MLAVLAAACGDPALDTSGSATSPASSPATSPPTSPPTTPGGSLPSSGGEIVVGLEPLAESFDQPVYVTAAPGDASRLFVVEKSGRVRVVAEGDVLETPFLDLTAEVSTGGEQGLLSIAFHPDYRENGRFYVNYTDDSGATRVVGFTAGETDRDRADMGSREDVLTVTQPYSNHNGGQLQFGPDRRLYVGMGDGGGAGDPEANAQDAGSLLGKLLRVTVGAPTPSPEVYASGLRNPWRFSFDRETGDLWIGDVGQGDVEEIDFLPAGRPAGANLGWNAYEGSRVFDEKAAASLGDADLVWPVAEYTHSIGDSVTGGYVYRGSAIPGLRGRYVFGDFSTGRVWSMAGPDATPEPLSGADGRVEQLSSFGEDAEGELYLVSLGGTVYLVQPAR
jgi:glucose/arabinose dehydrogenase